MSAADKQGIGNYILGRTIGRGATGKVKLATRKGTTEQIAIKIIKKSYFDNRPELKNKILREVGLMRLLNHANLLQLLDCEESSKHLYIVLEYAAGGELFDFLIKNGSLSPEVSIHFFREIIYALEYLHSHHLCHRDLQPENILLDSCNHIKLADFGFARVVKKSIEFNNSPHYDAPEILRGDRYDGRSSDIWSAGVVLYAMIAGKLPFDDKSLRSLVYHIKSGKFQMPECPDPLQDLLSKMLCVDPTTRISIQEIKKHPAFCLYSPRGFIYPSPLPLPNLNEPRDPSTVPLQYFTILRAIEYSDDAQIKEELLAEGRTSAKVFVTMLERTTAPFRSVFAPDKTCDINPEEYMVSPAEEIHTPVRSDAFGRFKMDVGVSSPETYSLAVPKMGWAVAAKPSIEAQHFDGISLGLEEAMAVLQEAFTKAELEWVYIDPTKLFVRNSSGLTVLCIAHPVTESELDLTLVPSAEHYNVSEFDFLVELVTDAISLALENVDM